MTSSEKQSMQDEILGHQVAVRVARSTDPATGAWTSIDAARLFEVALEANR
jgi:hypothetical protein